MKKIRVVFVLLFIFMIGTLILADVSAQTARFINHQPYQADFTRLYRSDLGTYWPAINDPASCIAREDIIIQVSPAGCQPAVVRSDLLAEQNVPVFCQLDALKINPLVDIKEIRNIRFSGPYPEGVVGVGFHPARAALRTYDRLLGSPLIDNIGYVVIVLEQNPKEDTIPEEIEFTLHARIDYHSSAGLGIGKTTFLLEEQGFNEWLENRARQSFWQGRYSVKLDDVDSNFAVVSIYEGERKINEVRVERGRISEEFYVPGAYCQAGLQVAYDGFVTAAETATIRFDDDILQVRRGTRFANGKCNVGDIDVTSDGIGKVEIRCGNEQVVLNLGVKNLTVGDEVRTVDSDGNVGDDLWKISEIVQGGKYEIIKDGEEPMEVNLKEIRPDDPNKLHELSNGKDSDEYFEHSINNLEQVADSYPFEKNPNEVNLNISTLGEESLVNAIELSGKLGKQFTEANLIGKLLELYPTSDRALHFTRRLNDLYVRDTSLAGKTVNLDNKVSVISLLDVDKADKVSSVVVDWGTNRLTLLQDFNVTKLTGIGEISLNRVISSDSAEVSVFCYNEENARGKRYTLRIGDSLVESPCRLNLNLRDVDVNDFAEIRLLPVTRGLDAETNFTVGVGIEKRDIELSPDKARDKIDNLQETIDRWESVSDSLDKVNTGLKGACFATAGVLTAKNFLAGLGGEGFARQKAMRGYWNDECADRVGPDGKVYASVDACYLGNAGAIKDHVDAIQVSLEELNTRIKEVEDDNLIDTGGLDDIFSRQTVNTTGAVKVLKNDLLSKYPNEVIGPNGETVSQIFDGASYEDGDFNYDQLREVMLNVEILKKNPGFENDVGKGLNNELINVAKIIEGNKEITKLVKEQQNDLVSGKPGVNSILTAKGQKNALITPIAKTDSLKVDVPFDENLGITHVARVGVIGSEPDIDGAEAYEGGIYLLGLTQDAGRNSYTVQQVFGEDGNQYTSIDQDQVGNFQSRYGIGELKAFDSVNYNNAFIDPKVRYFETDPYKGMPAVVPFDRNGGWYVATDQSLPVFGGIGSFDSSGRPVSFWLCNVGDDGREQFFENRANDICQLINVNTGQPLNQFPGLSEQEARQKINLGIQALQEAARQYGNGKNTVRINGQDFSIGLPASNIPGTQCQNFMTPEDCALLFNVCDPVICPSSRCDFGGQYHVPNVVQSGIIGSSLLCLPNSFAFGGDVAVPVCLTGIQAGIDGYLSILESHQQCLQENIETGTTVGICDEITSVYTCEFFWRQAAPLAEIIVPKAFEFIKGQTTPRGGGEYLTVQNAWDNARQSADFFTQEYAVNSIEAFNIRSTEEAGSSFCQAFIGAKGPGSFDTLIEPDSPPQFHAWFDEITFTDATVPATSQYKVFYHIFSGNDRGVHFRVFLKDPPESSFYSLTQTIEVAGGFVPKGEFVTDTVDFTSPEGYKQLCVRINDKEECGFTQVTTSFAVDFLSDKFVSEEINKKDITEQNECISGGTNPAALLNPNIQSGVEEAINPEIYNRGVVRICASQNPGSSTDPGRFVDSGFCDDPSIRCWLDQASVGQSLNSNLFLDEGIGVQTLDELQKTQIDNLRKQGQVLDDTQIGIIIGNLSESLDDLDRTSNKDDKKNMAREAIEIIDVAFGKIVYNSDRANFLMLKGRFYEKIALAFAGIIDIMDGGDLSDQDSGDQGDDGSSDGVVDVGGDGRGDLGSDRVEIFYDIGVTDIKTYDDKAAQRLFCGNEETNIYFVLGGDDDVADIIGEEVTGFVYNNYNGNSELLEETEVIGLMLAEGKIDLTENDLLANKYPEVYYSQDFGVHGKSYDNILELACALEDSDGEVDLCEVEFLLDGEPSDGEVYSGKDLSVRLQNCGSANKFVLEFVYGGSVDPIQLTDLFISGVNDQQISIDFPEVFGDYDPALVGTMIAKVLDSDGEVLSEKSFRLGPKGEGDDVWGVIIDIE